MLQFALTTCGLTTAFTVIVIPIYSVATFLQPCKAGNKKARQFKTQVLATSL